MKKKQLQKLNLEKFNISRLNKNLGQMVIGGNPYTLATAATIGCGDSFDTLCNNTKTESVRLTDTCPPPPSVACQI